MSSFDDEFGLFGDEATVEEERRPTLGARKIAPADGHDDGIEPEDERPARRSGWRDRPPTAGPAIPGQAPPRRFRRDAGPSRPPLAPEIAQPRAVELLTFLAKGLVRKTWRP